MMQKDPQTQIHTSHEGTHKAKPAMGNMKVSEFSKVVPAPEMISSKSSIEIQ
jgi:hypothetical protein